MRESRFKINNIDSDADDQHEGSRVVDFTKWAGGTVSLFLVLGVVYWAFQLGQRDANDVPVIQAMLGDARERPADPQGNRANNQGLDVNQVLASDQTAPVGAETQLAPPPQRAAPEDVPVSDQPPEAVPNLPIAPVEQVIEPVETLTVEPVTQVEADAAPENTALVADPNMTRPVRRVEQAGLSPSSEQLSNAIAAAIAQEAINNAATPAEPLVSSPDGTVSAVPVGTQMIQLGVFDDEQSAVRNWDFLLANQPDLLNGLDRYIERREAGGRVFYRLRATGFANPAAASDLCGVLMGRDVQCIPVAAR